MAIVLSADFPLHVETDGDDRRPALLLLNPLGTTLSFWDPLIGRLAEHYWVVRFDIRGHGRSVGEVNAYGVNDLADDALAVLDALEVPRAHVLGASLGALTGAYLAARHPDRVDRLVLASTGLQLGPDYWWEQTIDRVTRHGLRSVADHLEIIFFSEAWRDALPDRAEAARSMFLSTPVEAYLAGAEAIANADLRPFAELIRAPTLLIVGEDDPVLRHHPAVDLLSHIPDSEAVNVGGARHRVLIEQPELLGDLVVDFLRDPDAR